MPAPSFVADLLGYRLTRQGGSTGTVNISDSNSATSVAISEFILRRVATGEPRAVPAVEGSGSLFELGVRTYLEQEIRQLAPEREWMVDCQTIDHFQQYEHLDELDLLIKADTTGLLAVSIGGDYIIRPDTTISLPGPRTRRFLHAAVSCKWTLRSDRAQNVRHEANIMVRQRRGRLPHIAAVTMEPLPGRLASLARGTGDVDAVYHAAYDELLDAVRSEGTLYHQHVLEELIEQRRLLDLTTLPQALTY